jgi:hypothetical protein
MPVKKASITTRIISLVEKKQLFFIKKQKNYFFLKKKTRFFREIIKDVIV